MRSNLQEFIRGDTQLNALFTLDSKQASGCGDRKCLQDLLLLRRDWFIVTNRNDCNSIDCMFVRIVTYYPKHSRFRPRICTCSKRARVAVALWATVR